MAHSMQVGDFLEEINCSVCLELFSDPVILECGHNFCRACIDTVWDNAQSLSCPECRDPFAVRKYTVNRILAALVERVRKQEQVQKDNRTNPRQNVEDHDEGVKQTLCVEHKEELYLFCEEDETLACSMCIPEHYGHHFLPLQKAVANYREQLNSVVSSLESILKNIQTEEKIQQHKIKYIKECAQNLEGHIRSEFTVLHDFLYKKEHQLIQELKVETSGILEKMEKNLKEMTDSSNAIQCQISAAQSKLNQQVSLLFLKGIKGEMTRFIEAHKENAAVSYELVNDNVNSGVYKCPLQYKYWKEMKNIIHPAPTDVRLDSETAHPELIVFDGQSAVKWKEKHPEKKKPDNLECFDTKLFVLGPYGFTSGRHSWEEVGDKKSDDFERFDTRLFVLGSDGFTSGRHCWKVEVGDKSDWILGVAKQSCKRKGNFDITQKNGFLVLLMENQALFVCNKAVRIDRFMKICNVIVYLDYDGGQLSFYNASDISHLYTFHKTFTEKLFPVFSPCGAANGKNTAPLRVLPQREYNLTV
ncbi:zinc-binding protein A33-like [Protopterus annectens]|uniref:zinc-binding protein A33-like n=1 Tax=Protopterus annectens TaxID=7888 RepID=UPI001CFAE725|nr:zinc-binding protein A33-like [Protopterus annectens]